MRQLLVLLVVFLLPSCTESVASGADASLPAVDAPALDAPGSGSDAGVERVDGGGADGGSSSVLDAGSPTAVDGGFLPGCEVNAGFWRGAMTIDPSSTEPRTTCIAPMVDNLFNSVDEMVRALTCGCTCTASPAAAPSCMSSEDMICAGSFSTRITATKISASEVFYTASRTGSGGTCSWRGTLRWSAP